MPRPSSLTSHQILTISSLTKSEAWLGGTLRVKNVAALASAKEYQVHHLLRKWGLSCNVHRGDTNRVLAPGAERRIVNAWFSKELGITDIASAWDVSTSTVWRAVQRRENKHVRP